VRRILLALTFVGALADASLAGGQSLAPEESLRITHEAFADAVRQGNLGAAQGRIHPRALGFFFDSELLVQLGRTYGPTEALSPVIADLSRLISTNFTAEYRVVGDTGVACLTSTQVPKKGEKGKPAYRRLTYVYVRADGTWKLLSWHSSEPPLKR